MCSDLSAPSGLSENGPEDKKSEKEGEEKWGLGSSDL